MEKVSSEKLIEVGLMLSIANNLIQQSESILYKAKMRKQSKELRKIEEKLFLYRTDLDAKLESFLPYRELEQLDYRELNSVFFPLHSEIVERIEKML